MSVPIAQKLLLGIAASAALLPAMALAQTTSRAASPSTTMQLGIAATGIIEKIFVRDGDHVDAGQLLVTIDCRPLQAEIKVRGANVAAAEAAFVRARNGPRPDEIAIGEANVGVARARAEEAQAAYDRALELHEGITISRANLLQARRDARIAAAQLEDQKRRLDLLHAGSRAEDVSEAAAKRESAAGLLDEAKALFDQCFLRAPAAGTVKVLATPGQFVSPYVPVTLVQLTPKEIE
ncbi:MAG: rane fusion protein PltH [Methylobacteriaceae bacterium]|nr:rane fusion protein PltH [Methylobacteriaceae bacterium]